MTTLTLTLPEHWVPALLMDDFSGMDRTDRRAYARWRIETHELGPLVGAAVCDTVGRFFAWDHEGTGYGVPGAMCVDVALLLADHA
jgi:hypothetical protein